MHSADAKRNANIAVITNFLGNLTFTLPIWLLYSTQYLHFSNTLSVFLFAGVWFIGALFEIPTGAIADKWGRKKSFLLGSTLMVPYALAYLLRAPAPAFIAIAIIASIGNAFSNGSLSPLVQKSLERSGAPKKTFHTFLSLTAAALFLGRAASGITGAWLYNINVRLPFLCWLISSVLIVTIGLFIIEDDYEKGKALTYRAHIKETLSKLIHNDVVASVMIANILIFAAGEGMWTGYQVFYNEDHRSNIVIGTLFTVIAIVSASSAYLVKYTYKRYHPNSYMRLGAFLSFCTAFLLWQPSTNWRLLAIIPLAIVSGFYVVINAVIQSEIPNKLQSTALSVQNVAVFGTYAISSMMVGKLIDSVGISRTRSVMLVLATVAFVLVVTTTFLITKRKSYRLE